MKFHSHSANDTNWYSLDLDKGSTELAHDFKLVEFACKDGSDTVGVHPALVSLLQEIRNHFGAVVTILSGYRSVKHNRKIGGKTKSAHLIGLAADIVVFGVSPYTVAIYCEEIGVGGVGRYETFTHVDVKGKNRRWNNT